MLVAAFESWIDSITERGFDEAFLSLLRANGYYDVHFTHGAYENGRDVIAKLTENGRTIQCAFQNKAGDVSGAGWDRIFSQLYQLVRMPPGHPAFDPALPRRCLLVTTGRLVGKAPACAASFRRDMASQGVEFDVMDRERLIEHLEGTAAHETLGGGSRALVETIGAIVGGKVFGAQLERLFVRLVPSSPGTDAAAWRALLDNSICVRAFSQRNLPFHALTVLLNGIRVGACLGYASAELGQAVLREAMKSYSIVGRCLLKDFLEAPDDPKRWLELVGGGGASFVTYPSACLRVLELLGLSVLSFQEEGRQKDAAECAQLLRAVVEGQPGCAHPISDRYAGSLSCGLVALAASGFEETFRALLVDSTNWLCTRYESSDAGLASPYATVEEEVRTLLGAPFEGIELPQRRASLLAIVLADAAHTFAPDIYADVVNDFEAVGIIAQGLHAEDNASACQVGGTHTRPLLRIAYPATADEPLPHHALQRTPRTPERLVGPSACLALAALIGDRLFSDCYPRVSKGGRCAFAAVQ